MKIDKNNVNILGEKYLIFSNKKFSSTSKPKYSSSLLMLTVSSNTTPSSFPSMPVLISFKVQVVILIMSFEEMILLLNQKVEILI